MFDNENSCLDEFANELDPFGFYDMDGDGKTTFGEELVASDLWDDTEDTDESFSDYDFDGFEPDGECDDGDFSCFETIMPEPEKLLYAEVQFGDSPCRYSYRCGNIGVEVGDEVIVPVGHDKEITGKVVSMNYYDPDKVPFPIEKTKFISRKAEETPTVDETRFRTAAMFNAVAAKKRAYTGPNMGTPSNRTVSPKTSGNFFVSWLAFVFVSFIPFIIAAILINAFFFEGNATAGAYVSAAAVSAILCGFGCANFERAEKTKKDEKIQGAKYLFGAVAVVCLIFSLAVIGSSANNQKKIKEQSYPYLRSYSAYTAVGVCSCSANGNEKINRIYCIK